MTYGLLGETLSHSYSPKIHGLLADYEYRLFPTAPEELESFLTSGDFAGLNVTIPYKKAVIPYLAELSPRAQKLGSVNTVVRRADGTLYGDNTDYAGFRYMLTGHEAAVQGKKALVLGSGGASVTVAQVLRDLGACAVVVISRTGEDNYENLERHADAGVLVNATPVGMYPNNGVSPVDLARLPALSLVADVIYNPAKTALMLQAEALGIPAVGGLSMLVAQAKYSADLFLGRPLPNSVIRQVEQRIAGQMKNIILIGMPGCGKTVIGKRLAAILGRKWIDLDRKIEAEAGKAIPEIFAEEGEEGFRRRETACVAQICSRSGCVISTGGGVVTRPENRDLLRQNGTVVYLRRELDKTYMAQVMGNRERVEKRPMFQTKTPEELAAERLPLYLAWSDIKILNVGVNETAWQLISFLGLSPKKRGKKK